MAKYRQLYMEFWSDNFILELTAEEKYFYLFLITNSKTTQCGIYELPKKIIDIETGYERETIDRLLKKFQEYGKIKYSESTSEVMIINWTKYNKPNNCNAIKCVNKEIKKVKNKEFLKSLYKQYLSLDLDIESLFKGVKSISFLNEIQIYGNIENTSNEQYKSCKKDKKEGTTHGDTHLKLVKTRNERLKEEVKSEKNNNDKSENHNNNEIIKMNKKEVIEINKKQGNIIKEFKKKIHVPTKIDLQKIDIWSKCFDEEMIILAINQAVTINFKSADYIQKILSSWKVKGIETLNEAVNERERWTRH